MLNAIADAIGVDVFRRAPVTADIVLMSLEHGDGCMSPSGASESNAKGKCNIVAERFH